MFIVGAFNWEQTVIETGSSHDFYWFASLLYVYQSRFRDRAQWKIYFHRIAHVEILLNENSKVITMDVYWNDNGSLNLHLSSGNTMLL